MIAFSTTTAFRLIRRLAIGQESTALYLLICEQGTQSAIESDLQAEVEVQMSIRLTIGPVLELFDENDGSGPFGVCPIRALRVEHWSQELVALLDTHVIRLERAGAQFLFLTTSAVAEQLLVEAPNFRSRLTDVLNIVPDDPSKGGSR
jgi:hypothetical protein